MHPPPSRPDRSVAPAATRLGSRNLSPVESDSSITSGEVPLAGRKKGKSKAKRVVPLPSETLEAVEPVLSLEKRFHDMIYNDDALYIRILRYEVGLPVVLGPRAHHFSRSVLTSSSAKRFPWGSKIKAGRLR